MFSLIDIFLENKNIDLILCFRLTNSQMRRYVDNHFIWILKLQEIVFNYEYFRSVSSSNFNSYLKVIKIISNSYITERIFLFNLNYFTCIVKDIEKKEFKYSID